jgi:hypothetical protein
MYKRLGGKNARLVLAGIACVGIPAGVVLQGSGGKLRGISKRAIGDEDLDGQLERPEVVAAGVHEEHDKVGVCGLFFSVLWVLSISF